MNETVEATMKTQPIIPDCLRKAVHSGEGIYRPILRSGIEMHGLESYRCHPGFLQTDLPG